MTDRENIKMGLEEVSDFFFEMYKKETDEYKAIKAKEYCDIAEDALILLKEQEPMKPTWSQGKAYCGNCGHGFPRKSADREINYCSFCGQAVKWSD